MTKAPKSSAAHAGLGNYRLALGDLPGARAEFELAQALHERTRGRMNAAKAKNDMIKIGNRQEDKDEARAEWAKAQAYADQNGKLLSQAGHPVTPGTTYLAHFAGPKGAVPEPDGRPRTSSE